MCIVATYMKTLVKSYFNAVIRRKVNSDLYRVRRDEINASEN